MEAPTLGASMRLLFGVVLSVVALLAPAVARAENPTFTTTKLPGANGSTEPRMSVGRDDTRWVVTNASGAGEVVYLSRDGGSTWTRTAGSPPQTSATIDTDIVTFPSGRILSSELDDGGLNFPTGYSDDGGKTWTESRGADELADQDRQWFAVGPKDAATGQNPVYLLYHNFASGIPQHNMWVATSTDGGATFGPPVPTAQPGSDAYTDLQCSDSGGPSSITVNPKTGHIYVVFTTRAGIVPGTSADSGGCGASVFGPLEFNIVNATRVWVADSATGLPGSWHDSLAVDDSATQQVVSQQLAYGALDNAGNFYVAYPESPKAYPDLTGSGVKLTWQAPNKDGVLDGSWSKAVTLVPYDKDAAGNFQNGSDLVHLVAGDPGKVAVAYFKSETVPGAKAPVWYTHFLYSFDAQSQDPHVSDYKLPGEVNAANPSGEPIPTYQWTASQMMGICSSTPVVQGVENGLDCSRSTDVWGIALDANCRVMAAWPARGSTSGGGTDQAGAVIPFHDNGTFVTTQTGGPTLCSGGSLPGGSQSAPFEGLTARQAKKLAKRKR
jgi:hypothetical protein